LPTTELKRNAIGFRSGLVVGVATPAPAYSLAAVLGLVVATVGLQAPAAFLAAFVPMLFVASAFHYLNRADPDCGITFSWTTRAFGPFTGFLAGWTILVSSLIVMALLANTAALYAFYLLGWDTAAGSTFAVTLLGAAVIVMVTYRSVLDIKLSARMAAVLLGAQVLALLIFAVVALVQALAGDAPQASVTPQADWFLPFGTDDPGTFIDGVLVALFVYWGWDVALSLNEETEDGRTTAGRAGIFAVVALLGIYLIGSTGVLAYAGVDHLAAFSDESAFKVIAGQVLGSPLDKLVVLAVASAALVSAQATIIAQARVLLSMSRQGALPAALTHIHPRHQTPDVATWLCGALALAWYVGFTTVSESFLADSLLAIGLFVTFYHGITGLACAVYYRRQLLRSPRTLLLVGVLPLIAAGIFGYVCASSAIDFTRVVAGVETYWLGVQPPLVIAIGLLLAGIALVAVLRTRPRERDFFTRRAEIAGASVLVAPVATTDDSG
jgi:amino acid transporter